MEIVRHNANHETIWFKHYKIFISYTTVIWVRDLKEDKLYINKDANLSTTTRRNMYKALEYSPWEGLKNDALFEKATLISSRDIDNIFSF